MKKIVSLALMLTVAGAGSLLAIPNLSWVTSERNDPPTYTAATAFNYSSGNYDCNAICHYSYSNDVYPQRFDFTVRIYPPDITIGSTTYSANPFTDDAFTTSVYASSNDGGGSPRLTYNFPTTITCDYGKIGPQVVDHYTFRFQCKPWKDNGSGYIGSGVQENSAVCSVGP